MTLTGVVVAKLVTGGTPLVPALAIGVLVGVGIGLINATVVVVMRIDSFIGTLATGSLIQALITMVTNDTPIVEREAGRAASRRSARPTSPASRCRSSTARSSAVAIWYLLEHTATGRRLYATGFNPDAARLAGVPRRTGCASCRSSCPARSRAPPGSCSPRSSAAARRRPATPYLLPAFAAVFLGATQLKNGRFNAGGTIIAVLLLGTGTTGLALAAAPQWSQAMFVGVVLIASLAVTGIQRRTTVASRGSGVHGAGVSGTDQPGVATATPLSDED